MVARGVDHIGDGYKLIEGKCVPDGVTCLCCCIPLFLTNVGIVRGCDSRLALAQRGDLPVHDGLNILAATALNRAVGNRAGGSDSDFIYRFTHIAVFHIKLRAGYVISEGVHTVDVGIHFGIADDSNTCTLGGGVESNGVGFIGARAVDACAVALLVAKDVGLIPRHRCLGPLAINQNLDCGSLAEPSAVGPVVARGVDHIGNGYKLIEGKCVPDGVTCLCSRIPCRCSDISIV